MKQQEADAINEWISENQFEQFESGRSRGMIYTGRLLPFINSLVGEDEHCPECEGEMYAGHLPMFNGQREPVWICRSCGRWVSRDIVDQRKEGG